MTHAANDEEHGHGGHDDHGHGNYEHVVHEHEKLYKHANKFLNKVTSHHLGAYNKAIEKIEYDLEQLEDPAKQAEFAKTMADEYVSKAKQHFNVQKELDEFDKELLTQAYAGITKAQLEQVVKRAGKEFSHAAYLSHYNEQILPTIRTHLYGAIDSEKIQEKDIEGIVKHLGIEDKVNATALNREHMGALLRHYHDNKTIGESILRRLEGYQRKKKGGHDDHGDHGHGGDHDDHGHH